MRKDNTFERAKEEREILENLRSLSPSIDINSTSTLASFPVGSIDRLPYRRNLVIVFNPLVCFSLGKPGKSKTSQTSSGCDSVDSIGRTTLTWC